MEEVADVAVVGGGAFGASTALALARRGVSVTLIDDVLPGRATAASAGGLWPLGESLGLGCGVILHAAQGGVPEPLPRTFMDFLVASSRRFPALRDEVLDRAGVDIEADTGSGLLYLLYTSEQQRHARQILEWLGPENPGAETWSTDRVHERDPFVTSDIRGAVYFPGDNQVNPMLLAEGLKRAACAMGARYVSDSRVRGFHMDAGRVVTVETDSARLPCSAVVVAAGAWAADVAKLAGADIPVVPVRGQILLTETLAPGALRSNISTRDCYLLQKAHGEILVGSTTEARGFDTAVRHDDLVTLAKGAVRAVPALAGATLKRTWAGLRPGTPDELPILGPAAEVPNLFYAAGGFRTGIVAAPLAGELVAASIVGEAPPFPIGPFLASRFD